MWEVTYTHDKAAGLTYKFVVEAPSEEMAVMRAGMARAESFAGWFINQFFRPYKVRWERLSIAAL